MERIGLERRIGKDGTVTFEIHLGRDDSDDCELVNFSGNSDNLAEFARIDVNGKWLSGKSKENKVLKELFNI